MEVVSPAGGSGAGRFWREVASRCNSFLKMAGTTTQNNRSHIIEVSAYSRGNWFDRVIREVEALLAHLKGF